MVKEECAPYIARTRPCSSFLSCKPEAKVKRTYDVGGGYGLASEKAMMKEILKTGALNADIYTPYIFHVYSSGILTENGVL
jgi:hypothetical protein